MTEIPAVSRRAFLLASLSPLLSACISTAPLTGGPKTVAELDATLEGDQLPPEPFRRTTLAYASDEPPGSLVIDTDEKFLYLVQPGGQAIRYGVGVGREGFGWKGSVEVRSKQTWPRWFPPKEMIAREKARGRTIPEMVEGGPGNPLGARAMYLWQGQRDTLYRIHGTIEPWTIGSNVSSGCIRLANADVIDLYDRVEVGARVTVV